MTLSTLDKETNVMDLLLMNKPYTFHDGKPESIALSHKPGQVSMTEPKPSEILNHPVVPAVTTHLR